DFTEDSWKGISGGRTAVVDTDTAEYYGWKVGDQFQITHKDGQKSQMTVSALYEGNEMFKGIMVDTSVVTPHMPNVADMEVVVKTTGGASDATKDSLEKALGNNPAIQVMDKEDISDEIAQMISIMLNVLYGLLAMAVIVAVLGVVNTLAMSVFERRQEIGMLRAIGLDRRATKRMVRLESLVISLFGGVLGIGLGVFFGWAAGELMGTRMDTY